MKNAFFDPTTRILKAHGYMASNGADDLILIVPDSFDDAPGTAKLNAAGTGVDPYMKPPLTNEEKDAEATTHLDGQKLTKAVALWVADLHQLTPAQARQAILAKYRTL